MNPVPAPKEDGERDEQTQRTPSEIIKDITTVRLPTPFGRGGGTRATREFRRRARLGLGGGVGA